MKSQNKAIILGNVCQAPEVKVINSNGQQIKVARFNVATSTGGYTNKNGQQIPEKTQFHRITAWRYQAEYAEKYLHKGDTVYIEGEINYSEVEKDGKKTTYTEIVSEEISLCRSKDGVPQGQYQNPQQPQYGQQNYQQQNYQQTQQQYAPQQPQYGQQYGQQYPQQGYPQQQYGGYPQQYDNLPFDAPNP